MQRTSAALAEWLGPAYGLSNISLQPDLDDIPALAIEQDSLWVRLEKATFLTDDEKRAAVGYGPKVRGENTPITKRLPTKDFDPNQPRDDLGQWTSGDGGGDGLNLSLGESGGNDTITDEPLQSPTYGDNNEKPQNVAGTKKTEEILLPAGKEVGVEEKGAGPGIRTVTPTEFNSIKQQLLDGASQLPPQAGYDGKWYKRQDGTIFGIRNSSGSGETIDIRSSNNPVLAPGYKVHHK